MEHPSLQDIPKVYTQIPFLALLFFTNEDNILTKIYNTLLITGIHKSIYNLPCKDFKKSRKEIFIMTEARTGSFNVNNRCMNHKGYLSFNGQGLKANSNN